MNKVYVLILTLVLLLGLVNAGITKEFVRDTEKIVLLEDSKTNYGTIELKEKAWYDLFGWWEKDIVKKELKTHTPSCLINCESTGTTTLYVKGALFEKMDFYNREGKDVNVDYKIYVKGIEYYDVEVPDTYKEVCVDIKQNLTKGEVLESEPKQECYQEIATYKTETRNREVWNPYNFEILDIGTYDWKIEGKKKAGTNVDWVGTSFGQQLNEWAWWNNSWDYKRELTNLTGEYPTINISFNSNMLPNFADLVFVNSLESEELNFTVRNYTSSSWVYITVDTNNASSIYMYYGNNSIIQSKQSANNTFIFPVAYYSFDSGLNDSTGGVLLSNQGTVENSSSKFYISRDVVGSKFLNRTIGLIPSGGNPVTVCVWNYPKSGANSHVFRYGGDGAGTTFGIDIDTGKYALTGWASDAIDTTNFTLNNWNFVCGIQYNSTFRSLYVNGINVKNASYSSFNINVATANREPQVGNFKQNTQNHNGLIDELFIYSRAITKNEIDKLYSMSDQTTTYILGSEEANKITPSINLTIDKASPQDYLTTINMSCATDSDGTLKLWVNDTDYTSLMNTQTVLGAGSYTIKCNVTETETYKSGSDTENFTINKISPTGTITGTSPKAQGTPVDVSASETNTGDSDVTYTLYRNGTLVDNPDLNSTLDLGTYSYVYNSTEGANYTANPSIDTFELEVVLAPAISVILISPTNDTYSQTSYVELSANTTAVGGAGLGNSTVYVWNSNTDAIVYTNTQTQTGLTEMISWNVTSLADLVYKWNVYTCSNDSGVGCVWGTSNRTFTVDTTNPVVNIIYPVESETYNSVTQINYTVVETNPESCWYSKDGGTTNQTAVASGTNFTGVTVNSLTPTWTVYCNDSAGRVGQDSVSFNVNKIAVTLNSPANAYLSYTNLVTFNVSAVVNDGLSNLTNVSIYDNSSGTFASRNTTTISGTSDTETLSLSYGGGTSVLWNAYVCEENGVCQFSDTNRTYRIDGTAPTLSLNYPVLLNYQKVGDTIQINYTATDVNLDYCWYMYNGTTSTPEVCTSGTAVLKNIVLTLNKEITLYANDTAGNLNTTIFEFDYKIFNTGEGYETQVYETQNTQFNITIDYDETLYAVNALLNYDGTNYTSTETSKVFEVFFDVPLVDALVNKSFFWYFTYLSLSNSSDTGTETTAEINQTVIPINVSDCSSGNVTLNFTAYDEETYSLRIQPYSFYGTFNYWIGDGDVKKTLVINNIDVNQTLVCLDVNETKYYTDAIIQYEASGFTKRDYYFNNASLTTTMNSISLIMLNTTKSTSFVIPVKDSSQRPLTDAFVYIQKYYPGNDATVTVEIVKTDDSGNALGNLEIETEDYSFIVVKDGVTLYTSPLQKVYCSSTPCTLPIQISSTGLLQYEKVGNLTSLSYSGPTYNPATNMISYTYVDSSGTTSYGRLEVYRLSALGKTQICDVNSTSAAATLNCNITGHEGNIVAEAYISRSPETFVWSESFVVSALKSIVSFDGLFWSFLIIGILALAGVMIAGIPGGVLSTIVGMVVVSMLGIASIGLVATWGIIILGVFIIWIIKN